MTVSTRLGYTVIRKDAFNNLVTSGVDTVYLYSSSTGTNKGFFNAGIGGSQITSINIPNSSSLAHFWYFDDLPDTWTITASDNASTPDNNTGIDDASDFVVVSATPIVATRFMILDSVDTTVGSVVTVIVRAENAGGDVDTNYQDNITLVVSGPATGGGLVNIVNGVGTKQITTTDEGIVTLSLSDTENTGLDFSSIKTFSSSAVSIISIGGGASSNEINISVTGKTFPNARVTIFALKGGEIPIKQVISGSNTGSFQVNSSSIIPGSIYGLIISDKDGRSTQAKIYSSSELQDVLDRNILMSTTIGLPLKVVSRGINILIEGYATAGSTVDLELDSKITLLRSKADIKGYYKFLLNTASLDIGLHSVRTRQTSTTGKVSDFSLQESFMVSTVFIPRTDLNTDGVVNLQDASIFNSLWLSKDTEARKKIDFSNDGKVDIQDFSIFISSLKYYSLL
jgi:hypothetical protein